jgi:hypothetical protein
LGSRGSVCYFVGQVVYTNNWNNKLDAEVDGSITNEIQAFCFSNNKVYLRNCGIAKPPYRFDEQNNILNLKQINNR